ncbi:MAG: sulfite exporter TauE/SafE family protein [Candidatus Micrarchaeota archaeon]|nr:sulfite exporter TauE/SafE family protein [Candidatus Micrarchaeota archaeon]
MDPITIAGIIALGFVVGALVGLTSVGSGALMTPILLLDFGGLVGKTFVVGTATTQGTVTKFFGSLQNYFKKSLRPNYLFMISITGVPLAAIGAFYSSAIISWNLFPPLLAAVLLAVAVLMIYQFRMRRVVHTKDPEMGRSLRIKGLAVGVVVGLIAGLTGVSTGSVLVSALIILLKFPSRTAVSVAIFEGGLILLAATITQLYLGHVNLPFAGLLILGGVPGILLGGHFKFRVNQRLLGYGIAGVIILEASRTLSSFFFGKSFFVF